MVVYLGVQCGSRRVILTVPHLVACLDQQTDHMVANHIVNVHRKLNEALIAPYTTEDVQNYIRVARQIDPGEWCSTWRGARQPACGLTQYFLVVSVSHSHDPGGREGHCQLLCAAPQRRRRWLHTAVVPHHSPPAGVVGAIERGHGQGPPHGVRDCSSRAAGLQLVEAQVRCRAWLPLVRCGRLISPTALARPCVCAAS